jgi:hypothetical protein
MIHQAVHLRRPYSNLALPLAERKERRKEGGETKRERIGERGEERGVAKRSKDQVAEAQHNTREHTNTAMHLIRDRGATKMNGPLTLVHCRDLKRCRKQVLCIVFPSPISSARIQDL